VRADRKNYYRAGSRRGGGCEGWGKKVKVGNDH